MAQVPQQDQDHVVLGHVGGLSRTPSSGSSLERSVRPPSIHRRIRATCTSERRSLPSGGHRPFANFLVEQTLVRGCPQRSPARTHRLCGLPRRSPTPVPPCENFGRDIAMAIWHGAVARCLPGTTGSPRAIRRRPMQIGSPRKYDQGQPKSDEIVRARGMGSQGRATIQWDSWQIQ